MLNKYIIFGGILNEVDFMNSLVNSISKKFVDICLIEPLKDSLRFKIFFEDDGDKDNGDCDMVIELFKYEEKNHLLEFRRTKGSIHDHYDYFEKIKNYEIIETYTVEPHERKRDSIERGEYIRLKEFKNYEDAIFIEWPKS